MFSGTTQDFTEQLGALWCGLMHDSPMWPIHGQYECRTCGRRYFVPWAGGEGTSALTRLAGVEPTPILHRGASSFGSALLPQVAAALPVLEQPGRPGAI